MVTRKTALAAAAFATGIIAASCMQQQEYPAAVPGGQTESASFSAALSDGKSFPSGAAISGWKPEGAGKRYEYISEGGKVAEFRYAGDGDAPKGVAYLLYPSAEVDSLYRGTFCLKLKTEQSILEGQTQLYAGHLTADGYSELRPVTGEISFTVSQSDISRCRISCEDAALAGDLELRMYQYPRALVSDEGASHYVDIVGDMPKGHSFKAAVAAGEYKAFDITLYNSYGISVWEGRAQGDFDIAGGGAADIGEVGSPDISSLALTFVTSEFAGYTLKSVEGYSPEEGRKIMMTDVGSVLQDGVPLTVRFFGLEPWDWSSSSLWYVFTMERGGESIVLPIEVPGLNIPAASEVSADAGELRTDRNAAPWYYPYEDKRVMSGAGYAFGDANTYLIQYKGSSYGTSLDPDPDIPSSVTIDYRLRGELFGAPVPEDVTFEWVQGYNNATPAWDKYTMDRSLVYNCGNYSISVDADNYTVTVTNNGAHVGAPILVMKKDGEVLWAWAFWNIASDGTRLRAVDFGGSKLANLDIGHPSDRIEAIVGKLSEIRRATYYYQWGRPMPIFSQNGSGAYFSQTDARNASKPRIPVHDSGAVSVAEALKYPGQLIQNQYSAGQTSTLLNDWIDGGVASQSDLWGGGGASDKGVKSIYDPCPKGWRVPDARTYLDKFPQAAVGYSESDYPQEHTTGYQGVYVSDGLLFPCSGYFGTNVSADKYVSSYGTNYGTGSTASGAAMFWTNTFSTGTRAYAFRADYWYVRYNKAVENTARTIMVTDTPVGNALPVRCQVDEDNR